MIIETYITIGIALFVWCFLIDRDLPGDMTYLRAAQAVIYVVLGWPFVINMIVEETMEKFK